MKPPLGIPWLSWFAITTNFATAFLNTFLAVQWRRRMKTWNASLAEHEKSAEKLTRYAENYDQLVSFAIIVAHAPDGAVVNNELRALARSLIPPEAKYTVDIVKATPAASPLRVH